MDKSGCLQAPTNLFLGNRYTYVNSMLLCPEQKNTSPIRISVSCIDSPVVVQVAFNVVGVNEGGSGAKATRQKPSEEETVDPDDVPTETVTLAPGSPQPQTGICELRCRVM